MLEQDLASIMRFLTEKSGNPAPYYSDVPQQFRIPAVYFPRPEVSSSGDTLNTYALDFSLFVKFFHRTKEDAYDMGYTALNAILARRNRIPLIDDAGSPTGKYIHVRDPTLRAVDENAVQLQIDWTARKPFSVEPTTIAQGFEIKGLHREESDTAQRVQAAFLSAADLANKEPKSST